MENLNIFIIPTMVGTLRTTDIYEYTADLIILLERSDKNTFEKIDKVAMKKIVKIYNTEKEGISFLNKEDP